MGPRASRPRYALVDRDEQTEELFVQLAGVSSDQDSTAITEQIVLLYLDLCTGMANRYRGRGVEHDDLVQVARLGLVKAIRRYEPGRAPSFAAYAVPTVSGEIKKWFRDHGWVVRPPRRVQELRATVHAVRGTLEQELGADPTDTELAEAVGTSVDQLREVSAASTGFRPLSLDYSPSDDERPALAAFLACTDPDLEAVDDRVCLSGALTTLDDSEREVLFLRYVQGLSQREIGEIRGVSQMQVSRILRRITGRLHDQLVAEDDAPGAETG